MIEPEFRLLCLAISPRPDHAAIAAALAAGPDWPQVVEGARRHRVLAPVLQGLRPHAGSVPGWVLDRLSLLNHRSSLRALAMAAETRRLAELFAAGGIRMLVLKGAALSMQLHADVATRGSGDIDLLVHPAELWAADALLSGAGWLREGPALSAERRAVGGHLLRDLSYRRDDALVELHQRLVANPHCLDAAFDELWEEREEVDVGGATVWTLPDRLQAVYLCVHGATHNWERLRWLLDLALLLHDSGRARRSSAEAERLGLARPFRLALALAAEWLGTPLPDRPVDTAPFVRRFFSGDRWRTSPARGTAEWLRREGWRRLYLCTLKPGWRYPVTEVVAELTKPVDWHVLPLPARLMWLHPLLRPLGWVIRNLRGRSR